MSLEELKCPDLLPCPFCGGEAFLLKGHVIVIPGISYMLWGVGCNNGTELCYCLPDKNLLMWGTQEEAISAWNKRSIIGNEKSDTASRKLIPDKDRKRKIRIPS